MKIFISWSESNSPSWKAARLLREHLPDLTEGVEVFMSDEDILAGGPWRKILVQALNEAEFCIVCLDQRSLRSQWVLFEVGFIANSLDDASICPLVIGQLPKKFRESPLSAYQTRQADVEGVWGLILAITRKQRGKDPAFEQRLLRRYERFWKGGVAEEFQDLLKAAAASADEPAAAEAETREPAVTPPTGPSAAATAGPARPFKLALFNTFHYPRKGFVTHEWGSIFAATGILPEELVVRDDKRNELPSQIDFFDPSDPTRAVLAFSLMSDLQSVPEDYSAASSYVTVERGQRRQWPNQPQLLVEAGGGRARRVRLSNNILELWLELQPQPWDEEPVRDWYAGAATSVVLDGKDSLEAFRDILDMSLIDREKRCMQLDQLRLLLSGVEPHGEFNLIRNWYRLIAKSSGPVRSVVTVVSQPFGYRFAGRQGPGDYIHECRLYRTISLYRGANYVTEELRVYGTHGDGRAVIDFNTRYFSFMDMGLVPAINISNQNPKWFTISTGWAPYQGYGFATSADLSRVHNPEPTFVVEQDKHKTFEWELQNCRETACVHLFTRDEPKELESEVRRLWHEVVDRPLMARIVP